MSKIILMGYMASGKTILATLLAAKIQWEHIDLDQQIESKCNMSVSKLFESKGEVYFRKIEHQLLSEIIAAESNIVLSLGGGTPCYANNSELLKQNNIISFYLKASVDGLVRRLTSDKINRPLISNLAPIEMKEFIAKHLFERSFFYNQATHVINVDDKSPNAIVTEIHEKLV